MLDTDNFELELDTYHGESVRVYDDGMTFSPITAIITTVGNPASHLWLNPSEAIKLATALLVLAGARVQAAEPVEDDAAV